MTEVLKCLQTLEYDLRFEIEDPRVTAGTPLEGTLLVKLLGTITETRRCVTVDAINALTGPGGSSDMEVTTGGATPRTHLLPFNCPNADNLGDDGNYLLNSIWDGMKDFATTRCEDFPQGLYSLAGWKIKATCYNDRGICPQRDTYGQGDDIITDAIGDLKDRVNGQLGGGFFEDDPPCSYGPDTAQSLPQGLFGGSQVTWTPGSDIPFGHLPLNPCDVPDDYEFDCNLFEFIAEKIAEAKLSNAIGNIVINALGTVVTGGSFGLTDLISAIRAIRTGGRILGSSADILERAIAEAYDEYLRCLADSLEV